MRSNPSHIYLSFVSDLKKAALLFFVPRSQPSAISLLPTYVFSASPGSSLTFSADGHITASGSGTLLFQANEDHLEPLTFMRQILSHAELDSWNILSWDAAIVLATPKDKFPIKAVTIPLRHSKGLIRPIYLDTTTLSDMLGSTEFSIFSPDNMRIHLFTADSQATQKKPMVALQSDSTGNVLVISPIYTLRDDQAAANKSATIWKTVILTPYHVQNFSSDESGILPTPPPSPQLKPIACLSQAHPSCDTATSSVTSLPSDTCISLQSPMNGNNEPETLPSPNPAVNSENDAHDTFQIQKPSNLPSSQSIVAMFRALFHSIFFSVYLLLWGHRNSRPLDDTTKDRPQSEVSEVREDDDDLLSPLDKDAHDDSGDDSRESESLSIPETNSVLENNIEIQTTQVRPSQSDAKIPEATAGYAVSDVSRASVNTKGDVYYLQSEPSDSTSQNTATIALLYTTHNDSSTTEDITNAPGIINKNRIQVMDRCVQFLDGSEPECVVSRCNVDVFCHGMVPGEREGGSSSGYSCCLLQYQQDWCSDLGKSERAIRILPPGIDLLD